MKKIQNQTDKNPYNLSDEEMAMLYSPKTTHELALALLKLPAFETQNLGRETTFSLYDENDNSMDIGGTVGII